MQIVRSIGHISDPSIRSRMRNLDLTPNRQEAPALLARLRDGDGAAFDTLLRVYGGPLMHYAARVIGSMDAAQDVMQDVFLQLWRERKKIDVDWDIVSYLYGQTRRRSIDLARSHQTTSQREGRWATQLQIDSEAGRVATEQTEDELAVRAEVWDALSELSEQCREVFMLVWDHQLSYREIARRQGLAEPTVRNYVSRALKRLASVLGPRYRPDLP